jgi:hypothetical protein
MEIFLTIIAVEPKNERYLPIPTSHTYAFCFVKENNINNVLNKAKFSIERTEFNIKNIENPPLSVVREEFYEDKELLKGFDRCQLYGIAIVYIGIAKDKLTNSGPHEVPKIETIKVSKIQSIIKNMKNFGDCLHFNAGNECNDLINAHSIQKSGLLEKISRNGHVYTISRNLTDIKKNRGRADYKLVGINKISTFRGFCRYHDNILFEPIDNNILIPTSEQIVLYAYRSLCREIHAKSSVINKLGRIYEESIRQAAVDDLMKGVIIGNYNGLNNLMWHKQRYDESIKNKKYDDIRYVVYKMKNSPNIAFSGLIFPHYDFGGNLLQDIGNQNLRLDLFTFSSAPMENGWGYIISWHKSSDTNSRRLYRSLIKNKCKQTLTDKLFRLALNVENIGIKPEWWENLCKENRTRIIDYVTEASDPLSEIRSDYLDRSLEGITDWQISEIIKNI